MLADGINLIVSNSIYLSLVIRLTSYKCQHSRKPNSLVAIPLFLEPKITSQANVRNTPSLSKNRLFLYGSLQGRCYNCCIIARVQFWLECKKLFCFRQKSFVITSVVIPILSGIPFRIFSC